MERLPGGWRRYRQAVPDSARECETDVRPALRLHDPDGEIKADFILPDRRDDDHSQHEFSVLPFKSDVGSRRKQRTDKLQGYPVTGIGRRELMAELVSFHRLQFAEVPSQGGRNVQQGDRVAFHDELSEPLARVVGLHIDGMRKRPRLGIRLQRHRQLRGFAGP